MALSSASSASSSILFAQYAAARVSKIYPAVGLNAEAFNAKKSARPVSEIAGSLVVIRSQARLFKVSGLSGSKVRDFS